MSLAAVARAASTPRGAAASRRKRKQALTSACSSRWAGAITRSTEDGWQLAWRNLGAEARSLRARVGRIRRRLAVPCGERRGTTRGYGSARERFEKQRRLQVLHARLVGVEARLAEGRVSICRGGRGLARRRHHLHVAGLSETAWRDRWEAARWFLTADGEADKAWGNEAAGCQAVVVEDLDFIQARIEGREHHGRRPSRGRRGRTYRRVVAGIPTARFRDRLVQMATNRHLRVVAVDPAYTSKWGAQHWLGAVQQLSSNASGHHAAALVIGRRGLGQRARRRERCDSTRPEDRQERATNSAVRPMPDHPGLPEHHDRKPADRKARGQPHTRHKTQPADRHPPGDQVAQDRSEPPVNAPPAPR
jgi:hypothetical protein